MKGPSSNASWAEKIEHVLLRVEGLVAGMSLVVILLLSLIEIAARNFLHTGIPNASILIQYLVLWVSFFGAVLAVQGRHIKIDIATLLISAAWRKKLERPINFFSALVCAMLFWAAARFWESEWLAASHEDQWVAAMSIIFPVCFCLLSLHFTLCGIIGPRSAKRLS